MRVVHVSPTYFAPESVLGGGERFAEELSRAMSALADVRFVSFGDVPMRERVSASFERVVLRNWTRRKLEPFSPRLFHELRGADAIHCHQYFMLPTFLAALQGYWQGSRVFVTDLGGGGWTPGYHVDQSRWITAQLPLSEYAARSMPGRQCPHRVIHAGVALDRFALRPRPSHDGSLAFLGRLLPHKGVHGLLAALPEGRVLRLIGSAPDRAYLERLRALAQGKDVTFHLGLGDPDVVALLQQAMALIHPTPVDGAGSSGANELFGLALVEAMACGCPVIATDVASLPEIVLNGETGFLVPPEDDAALRRAIDRLASDDTLWARFSAAARRRVEERFTWEVVARRCLDAYESFATRGEGECGS